MKTLDELMVFHQSDKASAFSRTYAQPHNYCVHLEQFFEPIRNELIKFAEIGVGGGESIRAWLDYFPHAQIYGIDIVHDTNPFNARGSTEIDRYRFTHGNQSDPKFWSKFVEYYGGDWDVICDDGSHVAKDIRQSFASLWPSLKSGGIYVIEDLNFDITSIPWTQTLVSHMHSGILDIDSIYFARELAILRKK